MHSYSAIDVEMSSLGTPDICLDPGYLQELPPKINWGEELRNDKLVVAGRAVGRMVMRGFAAVKNKLHELGHPQTRQTTPRSTGTLALKTTIAAGSTGRHRASGPDWQGRAALNTPAWSHAPANQYPMVAQPTAGSGRHAALPTVSERITPVFIDA